MLSTNLNDCFTTATTTTINYSGPKPSAYIAVNKNRVKRYNVNSKFSENTSEVYLTGGTEFQIELFNPSQKVYLAKIEINGKLISQSGIVLYPGQRIFLDRYLDDAYKFKFNTYEVSGSNEEVKKAIENNGLIKIDFYSEQICYYNIVTTPSVLYSNDTLNNSAINPYTYKASNVTCNTSVRSVYTSSSTIETGRVDKGNVSKQKFSNVNKNFNYYSDNTEIIKVLPLSQKQYDKKDIIKCRRYCSNCGKKVNPNDKYCSNCGNKL